MLPAIEPRPQEEVDRDYNFHLVIFQKGYPDNCIINQEKIPPSQASTLNMLIKNAKRQNDYKIILPIVIERKNKESHDKLTFRYLAVYRRFRKLNLNSSPCIFPRVFFGN